MVVLEEDARLRINGHVDVRPSVVIEVVGNRRDGVTRPGFQDTRALRDVGKGPVAVVVIQEVGVAWESARPAHYGYALPLAEMRAIDRGIILRV